ncbi:ATP-binding cassette domain-containing protein [Dactylosporangium sp. NPDC000555]|uniref:ABC transporter ATP-binding protein n=1 Tax=Dactylosporangium sp. NPDC000555 TaxID=3154260 RepID=UPI003326E06D
MNLIVHDVVASYGRRVVLDGLSWQVSAGVTGLLGPNGAGKTTLLHLIAGITTPRRGTITAIGTDGQHNSKDKGFGKRIGFVPQHFTFAAEMSVRDTISYAAWVNGVPRRACGAAAGQALDRVNLKERADTKVRTLSGGQRQRLGVATALAHEPELLILDEPTVGLDPGQRLNLREVIADIGTRLPVILSTHFVEDVTHLCQRVGILAGGRMVFDDAVEKLAALVADASVDVGLGSPFERAYAGIIERLGGDNA